MLDSNVVIGQSIEQTVQYDKGDTDEFSGIGHVIGQSVQ